jgi:hypothetical protein
MAHQHIQMVIKEKEAVCSRLPSVVNSVYNTHSSLPAWEAAWLGQNW